ncbi:MAG: VCBS repeat-containing protein [Gemmatimonadaceae bacterium]
MTKSSSLVYGLTMSIALTLSSCTRSEHGAPAARSGSAPGVDGTLFTRMPSSYTGVAFENTVTETRDFNVFTYRNFYNGGGVAIGDLTGDGLPELLLTANQAGPKLYLNEGKFRFRDITEAAGVAVKGGWTTGVTFADVNGDGRLDIYICRAGQGEPSERRNLLFINEGRNADGIPTFSEEAEKYGIADDGYSTQAVFFDYDRDGKLDLYVINNSPRPVSSFGIRNTRSVRDRFGGARLYHNDGGHFTDVSAKAGIFGSEVGFGLGVAISDVNRDGWPDIYTSNDFFEQDYLYLNNHDGTFTESVARAMPYTSYFSMGLDIADIDNDGWPDIYTTDMLPEDDKRLKETSNFESWEVYQLKLANGYHAQFMRNMLQLNNGNGTFSDIGQMAGVARTDWSWSALIADLDQDGEKDIFVTNGLARDVTSQDYIAFLASNETMAAAMQGGKHVDFVALIKAMTSTLLPNYAFRNHGDRSFTNDAGAWGLATPSQSNGAAYGDLDGDGALDLVVNNINAEAFVYRNNDRALTRNHWLQVKLEGTGANRFALGARVTIENGGDEEVQELQPTRGFQSSVDYVLTFGLGAHDSVQSLTVYWPDGRWSEMHGLRADQRVTVRQDSAGRVIADRPFPVAPPFADVTTATGLPFVHHENDFVDFDRERLLPKLLSTQGPCIAVADVNGDGRDDIFVGGAKDQRGSLMLQQADGRFVEASQSAFEQDKASEDLGAVFFDADGDGDKDLYVVSGGSEFSEDSPALQDRLYLNDGKGNFTKASGALPAETISGSRVVAGDYDGDGDVDLFVGGRVVPWKYGIAPRSMLLRNDGHGHFSDVTAAIAPELAHIGMVTDAVWTDVDHDGRLDLVVVGEWMPITIFHNTGTRLQRLTVKGLEKSDGWWNRIIAGDFTGDGRTDFIVGNLGTNTRLQADAQHPVSMMVKDFLHDGFVEQVISTYINGKSYPLPLRDDLIKALPFMRARFPKYSDYAGKTTSEVFTSDELAGAVVKQAYTFATSIVRQNGDGSFTLVPLPAEAQRAPVYGITAGDVDRDGKTDLLLAGNFSGFKPDIGGASGSYGLYLRGDGKGKFSAVPARESGFFVPGDARDIGRVETADGALYIVTRSNARPLVFRVTQARSVARASGVARANSAAGR